MQTVLDSQLGFISISAKMRLSDKVELLPRDQVVLELLETISIDDAVIERCRALKLQGYYFARPSVLIAKRADPSQLALIQLQLRSPCKAVRPIPAPAAGRHPRQDDGTAGCQTPT